MRGIATTPKNNAELFRLQTFGRILGVLKKQTMKNILCTLLN